MNANPSAGADPDEQAVEEAAEDDAATASSLYRWRWLSTSVALWVVVIWPPIVVFTDTQALAAWARFVLHAGYLMSLVYSLGPGTLEAVREAREGFGP